MAAVYPPQTNPLIREQLRKDPMFLQRQHDAEVRLWRLLTGADVWKPKGGDNGKD